MESRQRASAEQFVILLEYMERNGDLARPQANPQGRLRADRLWQDLTGLINSVGGGVQKPTEKWKKVWADWKTKSKKKAINIRREASGTGGGPSNRPRLTAIEERVLSIMGLSAVTGDEQVQEQGFEVQLVQAPADLSEASPSLLQPAVSVNLHIEDSHSTRDGSPALRVPLVAHEPVPGTSSRAQEDVTRPTQESPPPPSAAPSEQSTPRRPGGRAVAQRRRRRRALTPFDRAVSEFVAVEERRLRMEVERDRRLHEREVERERMLHDREMERLRVESQRVEVERVRNNLFQSLADIPQLVTQLLQQSRQ